MTDPAGQYIRSTGRRKADTLRKITAAAFLALIGAGCGEPGYMPLEEGNWWRHEVESMERFGMTVVDSGTDRLITVVNSRLTGPWGSERYEVVKVMETSMASFTYYLSPDGGGLTAYRDQGSPVGEIYLQRSDLSEGDAWVTVSRFDRNILVHATVHATDATVETPSGTYEDCVYVSLRSNRELRESLTGLESLTWDFWWKPGVGMVKSVTTTMNPSYSYVFKTTKLLEAYGSDYDMSSSRG